MPTSDSAKSATSRVPSTTLASDARAASASERSAGRSAPSASGACDAAQARASSAARKRRRESESAAEGRSGAGIGAIVPIFGTRSSLARRASASRELGIARERPRDLDAIAVGEHRRWRDVMAEDRVADRLAVKWNARKNPGLRDRVLDRRPRRHVEARELLAPGRNARHFDPHRDQLGGYTVSARFTNASMNVLAMWPNTGPIALSRSAVANS